MNFYNHKTGGYVLITVLVTGFVGVVIITGLISWGISNMQVARNTSYREQALQIAEAGVEYYRWHLAHAPLDFTDGTSGPGPYVHPYYNREGDEVGAFSLTIATTTGTTIVTVRSTGTILAEPSVARTVEVRYAIPSLAKYAVAANANMRFGGGTEVFGQVHSNGGIRFDGLAHNIMTSALTTYTDTDSDACTGNSWAVHTCLAPQDVAPPTPWVLKPLVFEAGRQTGVPAVDFDGFTADLSQIKTDAQASGRYLSLSGALGYRLVLRTDDTFDVYRVNSLTNPPTSGCSNSGNQDGWGTWSINTQTFLANYAIPSNGLIFVEDNVWVEGQINTARVTIASGRFPESSPTNTSITINNNLQYTNYDGQDVIALIAQKNINVGLVSNTTLRIDGALVAKSGRVGRYYYRGPGGGSNRCSPYHSRQSITLFGMIATNQRYGFAYTDNTGYTTRNIIYDGNLLYGPPPSFPLTGDQYEVLSWKEVPN
jgi:Tfp pilus assembly protein PilV